MGSGERLGGASLKRAAWRLNEALGTRLARVLRRAPFAIADRQYRPIASDSCTDQLADRYVPSDSKRSMYRSTGGPVCTARYEHNRPVLQTLIENNVHVLIFTTF
ncbi:hypothetical protein BHE74_00011226 [Ensete ventricosum]|nr:hypothetical protein BHE74_00011226 [Ensete ventricosum]